LENNSQHKKEEKSNSLWSKLVQSTDGESISACILTPDTEEAFLRICAISEKSKLCRISFHLSIINKKKTTSFTGYWQVAIALLAKYKYSIYLAHNLLIDKREKPDQEEAEFHFIVDRGKSNDKGERLEDLSMIWKNRLSDEFNSFGKSKGALTTIKQIRVTRPKGVGAPCFFASNAKPGDGIGSKTAEELCRMLEGHGFIPVNIDVAEGGRSLRDQVRDLINFCHFMVVLHSPEDKLIRKDGSYGISDWVAFEEGVMSSQYGEIIRIRFYKISEPSFEKGFIERIIPDSGLEDSDREDFKKRLKKWETMIFDMQNENISAKEIPSQYLDRDLVQYYGGR